MRNLFFLSIFALAACGGRTGDWKAAPADAAFKYDYQVVVNKQQARIEPNDSVMLDYTLRNSKGIVASSYEMGEPVWLELPNKMYRNSFEEPLIWAGEGDSLEAEFTPEQAGEAIHTFVNAFPAGERVLFTYKIHRVVKRADILRRKETAYALAKGFASWDAYDAERNAILARKDSILQRIATAEKTPPQWTTAAGLDYHLYQPGTGAPIAMGDTVWLYFALQVQGGKLLDNTFQTADRFGYIVGDASLKPFWAVGMPLLKRGAQALFLVPPALGYGAEGMPPAVPANAKLWWYVEVMDSF